MARYKVEVSRVFAYLTAGTNLTLLYCRDVREVSIDKRPLRPGVESTPWCRLDGLTLL